MGAACERIAEPGATGTGTGPRSHLGPQVEKGCNDIVRAQGGKRMDLDSTSMKLWASKSV